MKKNIAAVKKYISGFSRGVDLKNSMHRGSPKTAQKGPSIDCGGSKENLLKNRPGIAKYPKHTFIDLFAGIGGFRLAFEQAGAQAVFSSEWDKFARISYEANFGELPHGDIYSISSGDIPSFDILCAGFPCQPFSIAGVSKKNSLGKKHGLKDRVQGQLIYEIVRILREKRPKIFLLENVKNLLSHNRGKTFEEVKRVLEEEAGYAIRFQLFNASGYVPQNRERLFIVGFRNREDAAGFQFPEIKSDFRSGNGPVVKEILEKNPDKRYFLSDHLWNYLKDYKEKHRLAGNGFGYSLASADGITRTLSARYYKDGSEILIPVAGKNPRRLTPRECARLMGFPDDFKIVVSDTQAYKQFGNAVVVPVVRELAKSMIRHLNETNSRTTAQKAGQKRERIHQEILSHSSKKTALVV